MRRDRDGSGVEPGVTEIEKMVSARLTAMGDYAESRVPRVSGEVVRGAARRRDSLRSPRTLAIAACIAAGAIALAVVGTAQVTSHPPAALRHAPAPTVRRGSWSHSSSKASSPATAPTSSSAPPALPTTVRASLSLVVCPTTFGIPAPAPVPLPTSVIIPVLASVVGELAVYSNNEGTMEVVGPCGWFCTASIAADGSEGVVATPPGEVVPARWTSSWGIPVASTDVAVVGIETSACFNCTTGQACPLFPVAISEFASNNGRPCPGTKPPEEIVDTLGSGIVAFQDPAGVAGDGIPSGGAYAANGVMTFHPGNPDGSYLETCTLPSSAKPECTAALNAFVAGYGAR
ncbi:MAG: hypothetical protein ACYCV5_11015 [Acidimicrobiales bacterium]